MKRRQRSSAKVITAFSSGNRQEKTNRSLRSGLDGLGILGELNKHLVALDEIDQELANSIQDFEREVLGPDGTVIRTEVYKSTILDKETIAVYHTRQAGRKMQIDTVLKMLNKVMPDLKAVDDQTDLGSASDRAYAAFAEAASQQ